MRNLQKLAASTLEKRCLPFGAAPGLAASPAATANAGRARRASGHRVWQPAPAGGRLDAWLAALLERPLTDPELGWLLRVAIYQLAYTRAPAHAVVHNAVTAAGQGWRRGLANAVLRNFQRRRAELEKIADDQPSARWSHPGWWIEKLQTQHPTRWQAMLEASLMHPPFTLRVNCRHGDVASYLQRLAEAELPARQTGADAVTLNKAVSVHSLPGFDTGHVSVQDAGAQWAAHLLDAQPGDRVLEACAAPGGKTGHILERADVALTALDVDAARLTRVQENLDRLHLDANLVEGDAAQPDAWWDGQPYDRILADVPCSASGVVRRNPDIKWLRRPDDIAQFAAQQSVMLESLWRLLAPGGTLLYATCSIFNEENDGQVQAFLARHAGDAKRCPLPEPLSDGSLLPDAEHDGFYYALLRKT